MTDMYTRLEQDTARERQHFMRIPIVQALLGESATASSPMALSELPKVYRRFLIESYYHVRAAAKVYAIAGARVSEEDETIRHWLLQHAVDEYGHHEWIQNDLAALGFDASKLSSTKPSVPSDALVAWMYYVASVHNPIAILADSFVIEGLSQLFATQLAGAIQSVASIPDEALTYLARHGIADQSHMDELRDLVNRNIHKESDYRDMLQCAKVEFSLYGQILELVTQPDTVSAREPSIA